MTYRVLWLAWSDSHEAISMPLQCPGVVAVSSNPAESSQLSLTDDGVTSMTRPGKLRAAHISCIASSPRYFHDDSITMAASV